MHITMPRDRRPNAYAHTRSGCASSSAQQLIRNIACITAHCRHLHGQPAHREHLIPHSPSVDYIRQSDAAMWSGQCATNQGGVRQLTPRCVVFSVRKCVNRIDDGARLRCSFGDLSMFRGARQRAHPNVFLAAFRRETHRESHTHTQDLTFINALPIHIRPGRQALRMRALVACLPTKTHARVASIKSAFNWPRLVRCSPSRASRCLLFAFHKSNPVARAADACVRP